MRSRLYRLRGGFASGLLPAALPALAGAGAARETQHDADRHRRPGLWRHTGRYGGGEGRGIRHRALTGCRTKALRFSCFTPSRAGRRDRGNAGRRTIIGTAGTMHEQIVALARASPDSPPNDSSRP